MMNQSAASATRRPSGGPTATAGCCPMLVHPQFFVNTFASQAPPPLPPPPTAQVQQCLLGAHNQTTSTNQLQLSAPTNAPHQLAAPVQTLNANTIPASLQNGPTNLANLNAASPAVGQLAQQQGQPRQQQQQQQQQHQQDQHSNYSTSISAHTLPLQHLLATRHSASNCMALAAALASASFHQQQLQQAHQQQQQHQHHHHHNQTPINHSQQQSTTITNAAVNATNNAPPNNINNTNASTTTNTTTITTNTNTNTNQVPILTNFNSYNAAQPFLNVPAPVPLAAHLNLSNNTNHQPNNISTQNINNNNNNNNSNATQNTSPQVTNAGNHHPVSHRPLATNTTLNSAANQQQPSPTNYRTVSQPLINQQQQPTNQAPQHPAQVSRSLLSDEALSSLLNEHFQALLLNQLFANPQFAPPPVAPPPAGPQLNAVRPPHISPPPSGPLVMTSAQQTAPITPQTQQQQQQQPPAPPQLQPPQESTVADQAQHQQLAATFQPVSQATAQTRVAQAPPPSDTYTSSVNNINYQQPQVTGLVNSQPINQSSDPVPLQTTQQQQQQQQQSQQQQPQQLQQQQQPQPIPPPIPFYSFPQMEQALALLTNPQVANNLFSHVFNIYLQGGLRTESHHTHHHHHPPHHYHHHLHGSHHHHHHHHGPNGQNNGQDDTMLTISESKPRGLNRAEIDSLTPYIQMNEKDSRTCVICLSKFELKSKIRPLPCTHAFHAKCVDKWLRANRTCPICRRDALKTYVAKIKRI